MTTTAIIICAGEATRWSGYLGVPKHFAPLGGEPILYRTVRLIREHIPDAKIHVVARDGDDRYRVPGTTLYVPKLDWEHNRDADKFLSSQDLWSRQHRTIVFYGDVYFTDAAMKAISAHQVREWTLFARFGPSHLTGTRWGECFAQSFWPEHLDRHLAALERIARLSRQGVLHRCGGWESYRAILGTPDREMHLHRRGGHFYEIDDMTDDLDFPEDYDRLAAALEKGHR